MAKSLKDTPKKTTKKKTTTQRKKIGELPDPTNFTYKDFNEHTILEEANAIPNMQKRIRFLKWWLKEWELRPDLHSYELYKPTAKFADVLNKEIEFLKGENQMQAEVQMLSPQKMIWTKNKQDFIALFDAFITSGYFAYRKDIYIMLSEHFAWIDGDMKPELLKHLKNNIVHKPEMHHISDEVEFIIKKLSEK